MSKEVREEWYSEWIMDWSWICWNVNELEIDGRRGIEYLSSLLEQQKWIVGKLEKSWWICDSERSIQRIESEFGESMRYTVVVIT